MKVSSQWLPVRGPKATGTYRKLCKHKKTTFFFHSKGGQSLDHIAQRSCGVSVLGDALTPVRHGPEQPAPGDPALDEHQVPEWGRPAPHGRLGCSGQGPGRNDFSLLPV